uniref:Uncharacterized protein n=1 Tax=Solanum lycopersicum TaxID=4081 RepID=A0A3Q7HKA3_SOLLC
NSDDDFVNPPPPSTKVTGKRKKGQSVSPAKRDSEIPSVSVSLEKLMRNELSELPKEVREEFKDIQKLINDNFNIIMSTLKNNISNHNAAQGRQHFTSPVTSENQNQVGCNNFPVRNLINVDAGFSSSKSINPSIPQPSFVFDKPKKIRPLVFERQHDFTHQDDNDEEDHFIFPTPIQSTIPMEGSPQSQFELDDSLMPSLSDIK